MEQQLKRRALSAAIFVGAIVVAGCGGGASGDSGATSDTGFTASTVDIAGTSSSSATSGPTSSTVAETAMLHVRPAAST